MWDDCGGWSKQEVASELWHLCDADYFSQGVELITEKNSALFS